MNIPPRPDDGSASRQAKTSENQGRAVQLMSEAVYLCKQHGLDPRKLMDLLLPPDKPK